VSAYITSASIAAEFIEKLRHGEDGVMIPMPKGERIETVEFHGFKAKCAYCGRAESVTTESCPGCGAPR
jgi:hypothetical protein